MRTPDGNATPFPGGCRQRSNRHLESHRSSFDDRGANPLASCCSMIRALQVHDRGRRPSLRSSRHAVHLVVVGILSAACGSAQTPRAAGAEPTSTECPTETRRPVPVQLSDRRVLYVEPMAYASIGPSSMIAGAPAYAWRPIDGGRPRIDSTDASMGIVFQRSGQVTALPKPRLAGSVTDIRVLPDGNEYAAVFAQVKELTWDREPTLLGYWFGRTDGTRWDTLEPLPLPPTGRLNTERASQLIRAGDALMIAALVGSSGRQDVVLFTRSQRGWIAETVPTQRASYVALAGTATPFLYVVWPDITRLPDANSLSLFVRVSNAWQHHGVLIRGGSRPVHHPTVTQQGQSRTLSWIRDDDVSRIRDALASRIQADGTLGPAATLATGVEDLFPVSDVGGPPRWVVSERKPDGTSTLSLVEWGNEAPRIRDVIVNPFTGPAIAYATAHGDVVVGPVQGRSPGEAELVSGVVPLQSRCSTPLGGPP